MSSLSNVAKLTWMSLYVKNRGMCVWINELITRGRSHKEFCTSRVAFIWVLSFFLSKSISKIRPALKFARAFLENFKVSSYYSYSCNSHTCTFSVYDIHVKFLTIRQCGHEVVLTSCSILMLLFLLKYISKLILINNNNNNK